MLFNEMIGSGTNSFSSSKHLKYAPLIALIVSAAQRHVAKLLVLIGSYKLCLISSA